MLAPAAAPPPASSPRLVGIFLLRKGTEAAASSLSGKQSKRKSNDASLLCAWSKCYLLSRRRPLHTWNTSARRVRSIPNTSIARANKYSASWETYNGAVDMCDDLEPSLAFGSPAASASPKDADALLNMRHRPRIFSCEPICPVSASCLTALFIPSKRAAILHSMASETLPKPPVGLASTSAWTSELGSKGWFNSPRFGGAINGTFAVAARIVRDFPYFCINTNASSRKIELK